MVDLRSSAQAVDGKELVRAQPALWAHRMHTDEVADLTHAEGAIGCLLSHDAAHRRAASLQLQVCVYKDR